MFGEEQEGCGGWAVVQYGKTGMCSLERERERGRERLEVNNGSLEL